MLVRKVVWIFGSICLLVFRRNGCSENFWISSKTSMLESFLKTLAGLSEIFPKSYLEQLFCREPVRVWFFKKKFHSTLYLTNFSRFSITRESEGCSLQACSLLKRTVLQSYSWNFSEIFKTPLRYLIKSSFLVIFL